MSEMIVSFILIPLSLTVLWDCLGSDGPWSYLATFGTELRTAFTWGHRKTWSEMGNATAADAITHIQFASSVVMLCILRFVGKLLVVKAVPHGIILICTA